IPDTVHRRSRIFDLAVIGMRWCYAPGAKKFNRCDWIAGNANSRIIGNGIRKRGNHCVVNILRPVEEYRMITKVVRPEVDDPLPRIPDDQGSRTIVSVQGLWAAVKIAFQEQSVAEAAFELLQLLRPLPGVFLP